jgi:dehydratase
VLKGRLGRYARPGLAGAIAIAGIFGFSAYNAVSASASTAVTLACEGSYFTSVQFTLDQSFTDSAPTSKAPGVEFYGSAYPGSWVVPTEVDGVTISALQSVSLTVDVSDATVDSATISGGSNLGTGTPSVAYTSTSVTLTVPGPLTSGDTVTFPTVNLGLTGTSAGTATTYIGGTSYASPGATVTAVVPGIGDAAATCYPTPAGPIITSTTIT